MQREKAQLVSSVKRQQIEVKPRDNPPPKIVPDKTEDPLARRLFAKQEERGGWGGEEEHAKEEEVCVGGWRGGEELKEGGREGGVTLWGGQRGGAGVLLEAGVELVGGLVSISGELCSLFVTLLVLFTAVLYY